MKKRKRLKKFNNLLSNNPIEEYDDSFTYRANWFTTKRRINLVYSDILDAITNLEIRPTNIYNLPKNNPGEWSSFSWEEKE